ncbi:MAG TPA: DUF1249 domain-containing protein [Gammaproteobacteria bacterium]|jgi:hypothetical protein
MLVDSLIVPQCVYRPGSFTGLMTIYESNYLKLGRLVTQYPEKKTVWTSSAPRDCDLDLEVLRREPYTTTLRMTYWFLEGTERVPDPDLTVRVYHDARLAEAVTARVVHHHEVLRDLDPAHAAELGRRWRINMMLNKWLDYLADVGHSFR